MAPSPHDSVSSPESSSPGAASPGAEIARISRGSAAYRKLAIALLMAGFSTFALMYDVQPLLPLFTSEFSVNAAQASLAISLTTAAMALVFIPAGALSDRLGRRPVMLASMFASAILTIASAMLPGWGVLLAMRALVGIALAGVPSVAMAYVSEEVDATGVGAAMGLYISGSAIGGMVGRLGMTWVADLFGWRVALATIGAAGLIAAFAFLRFAPASRAFTPNRQDAAALLAATKRLFADRALPLLYVEGFLLMGVFVTIYNYIGFRLLSPPYSLTPGEVGLIFVLYLIGSYTSAWFGGLAGRVGRRNVFWIPVAGLIVGAGFTAARPLALIVLGVAIVTGAFFAAHSVASSWVGRRVARDRAQAAAFYLLFYYLGSSVLGTIGGFAWSWRGWPGVVAFTCGLAALALVVAARLAATPPLAPPHSPGPEEGTADDTIGAAV